MWRRGRDAAPEGAADFGGCAISLKRYPDTLPCDAEALANRRGLPTSIARARSTSRSQTTGQTGMNSDFVIAARSGSGAHRQRGLHFQPIGVGQQLFHAHFGYLSSSEIADRRLIFVENLNQLALCVAPLLDFPENSVEQRRFHLQRRRFGTWQSEIVEHIPLRDVAWPIFGLHLFFSP